MDPWGWEDSLEKGMANQSSILAWKIPWTEEPGGLQYMVLPRVGHNRATLTHSLTDNKISESLKLPRFLKNNFLRILDQKSKKLFHLALIITLLFCC